MNAWVRPVSRGILARGPSGSGWTRCRLDAPAPRRDHAGGRDRAPQRTASRQRNQRQIGSAEGPAETRQVTHRAAHQRRTDRGHLRSRRYDPRCARGAQGAVPELDGRALSRRLQARGSPRATARVPEHPADPRRVVHRWPVRGRSGRACPTWASRWVPRSSSPRATLLCSRATGCSTTSTSTRSWSRSAPGRSQPPRTVPSSA
mgnify:CR=1 FL=1